VMVMVFSSMLLIPSRGQPSTLLEKDVSEYLRRIIEDYLCDKFLIYVDHENVTCSVSSCSVPQDLVLDWDRPYRIRLYSTFRIAGELFCAPTILFQLQGFPSVRKSWCALSLVWPCLLGSRFEVVVR